MIALVDYGAGNLTSVRKALSALAAEYEVPSNAADLARAAGIIVPGVGHFGSTMRLDASWRSAILDGVNRGVPLLGVCVGMQWLFEGSDEAPDVPGLGVLRGRCVRLPDRSSGDADRDAEGLRYKVPHVGWNSLVPHVGGNNMVPPRPSQLLTGVAPGSQVYFTHSYAAPVTDDCVAVTTHATPFAAAVERDAIFGVQFHPEKSADTGLRIIGNFLAATTGAPHGLPEER